MKIKIRLLISALLVGSTTAYCLPPDIASNYDRIWADEFSGTALNTNIWNIDTRTWRIAHNTADAVSVGNGNLVIKTYTENGKHYTGYLSSRGNFSQPFGYYEARIKFHDRSGMWSAFWLMPHLMVSDQKDPASFVDHPNIAGVEMDVVEHREVSSNNKQGNNPQSIVDKLNTGLHWDGYGNGTNGYHSNIHVADADARPNVSTPLQDNYHVYGVEWTPDGYKVYCDDQLLWQTTKWTSSGNPAENGVPYRDTINYSFTDTNGVVTYQQNPPNPPERVVSHCSNLLLLTSEIEGASPDAINESGYSYSGAGWAGRVPAGGYGSKASTDVKMEVDWVRVYARKPSVSGQRPFVTRSRPCLIEAEDFDTDINPTQEEGLTVMEIQDEKGKFVSYYDKNVWTGTIPGLVRGNNLTYRPETMVDINTPLSGTTPYVTNALMPDWLEYTAGTPKKGFYAATLRLANMTADRAVARLFVDGVSLGGVTVEQKGAASEENWQDLSLPKVLNISDQSQIVARVEFYDTKQPINFDSFQFTYLGNVAAVLEAENGVLGNVASSAPADSPAVDQMVAGDAIGEGEASKYAKVKFPQKAGAFVRWTGVDGYNGGNTTLTFRYSGFSGGTAPRELDLYVSGTKRGATLSFPYTMLRSYANVSVTTDLAAGKNNTIELRRPTNGLPFDLDCLVVSGSVATTTPPPPSVMFEAETATRTGIFTEIASTAASGGKAVDGIGGENNALEWSSIAGSGGAATVIVRYSRSASAGSQKSLFVNGAFVAQASFPATASWGDFQTVSIPVTLPAGSANTIMMKNNGAADDNLSIRLDNITITQ